MSRYLVVVLLLLTFGTSAVCATKPIKPPVANPTVEFFSEITKGNTARVKSLIAANPQLIEAKSKDGKTGLQLALTQKKPEIAAFLRKNGALDEPPRLDIAISGSYKQPGMSADGTKKEWAKWILRAEIKNAAKHRWHMSPIMALFHSVDKQPFIPIITIPNIPSTLQAHEMLELRWPWEDFLVQKASADAGGRGFSGITQWDIVLNMSDPTDWESEDDEVAPWMADVLKDDQPVEVTTDHSFAGTMSLDAKAAVWAATLVGPSQSLTADWESVSLASPEELKDIGVADGAIHELNLVGPIVYDPDDPGAGVFVVISRIATTLASPGKSAKPEVVQLTSKYIKEQIDKGPSEIWKAYFVSLLWDQTRVIDNPDDLLLKTLARYEEVGPLVGGTAGVCLEQRKYAPAIDSLISIASNPKADEKMRRRIINGLYAFDTPAVRDCLTKLADNPAEPYLVRVLALTSLSKCPQCDWTVIERFKQDKTLGSTARTLIEGHDKTVQPK